ncbi:MAG: Hsp20/alpha crystallin family protein [Euryarchaeota archaeon]
MGVIERLLEETLRTGSKGAGETLRLAGRLLEEVLHEGRRIASEAEPQEVLEEVAGQLVRTLRWTTTPAVDVYERPGELVIVAEVPGAGPDDVSVRAGEDYVEITVKLPRIREGEPRYRERVSGKVSRRIDLDVKIDPSGVEARCGNGLLTIRAPKVEEAEVEVEPEEE